MAVRTDVTVDWQVDPRVATVAAPSTEFIMQDVVDTLRIAEYSFRGMTEPFLVSASGKEPLGGGVSVGITVALQNTTIEFEARDAPIETGTITNDPVSPIADTEILEDNTADFISAGAARGSAVINFTDGSTASVLDVISATELRTTVLEGGSDNSYQIGDAYEVYGITQVTATGGNLTAVDTLQSPISPVSPTFGTQVLLTASSSATLQEQQDIEFGSFRGGVAVDIQNKTGRAVSGQTFPAGTSREPCNNWADAKAIADDRGFFTFFVLSDTSLPTTETFDQFTFIGDSAFRTQLFLTVGASVTDCNFEELEITGTLDGASVLNKCRLLTLQMVNGFISQCEFTTGTLVLGGSLSATIINSFDGTAGTQSPVIDMGGAGQELTLRNFTGGVQLINKSGADAVSVSMVGGRINIANSVTNGQIVLRGTGEWDNEDTYTGGATIINELVSNSATAGAVWEEPTSEHETDGTFGNFVTRKLLTVTKFLGLK